MLKTSDLFDFSHSLAASWLADFEYPWEALKGIKDLILSLGPVLGEDYEERMPQVWVHKTAVIAPSAWLGAPCIIGAGTEIRHCAFIRGSALVGENCVVGNSVELKNVILLTTSRYPTSIM
jgi:NDP-sugar pyrophosphorylase family protein